MNEAYRNWIDRNIPPRLALGKCKEWTAAMSTCFPELKRVRGHIILASGYEREHWWLETEQGKVVDPTEAQYTDPEGLFNTRVLKYTPWDESKPEPTGKCPNCGGYCYDGKYCCSDTCARAYEAYCNNPNML